MDMDKFFLSLANSKVVPFAHKPIPASCSYHVCFSQQDLGQVDQFPFFFLTFLFQCHQRIWFIPIFVQGKGSGLWFLFLVFFYSCALKETRRMGCNTF